MPLISQTAPYFNPSPPTPTPMPTCVPVAPTEVARDPYRKRSPSSSRWNKFSSKDQAQGGSELVAGLTNTLVSWEHRANFSFLC